MLKQLRKRTEGFTIIEVMIVLAIAGLILLIVFLAVPALQRNSRNTNRKNDIAATLGAITEYANNNSGAMPASDLNFCTAMQGAKLGFYTRPTAAVLTNNVCSGAYTANGFIFANNSNATVTGGGYNDALVYVSTGSKCNATATDFGGTGQTTRTVAAVYAIETASGRLTTCQES